MKKNLKYISVSFFILATILPLMSESRADSCPTPPTKINPKINVKIDFDKKTGIYSYKYDLVNERGALLSIENLRIQITSAPTNSMAPSGWVGEPWIENDIVQYFGWSANLGYELKPGKTQKGFVIKSTNSPGLVRAYTIGETGDRVGTSVAGSTDDEPIPDCEGFYDDLSALEGMVTSLTLGPVGSNQLSVGVELKDSKGERDYGPVDPYGDKGFLNVLVKGKGDLDVKEIDLSTVRFGVGKAAVVSSRKIGNSNNLLLQFKTKDVAIECGRDRVLFLTGKMKDDGKEFLGGAPVKTKNCDKRPKRKTPKRFKRGSKKSRGRH
jgi:hypothetical protein